MIFRASINNNAAINVSEWISKFFRRPLAIAQETLTEFISKATELQLSGSKCLEVGMKLGLDSIGIVAISHGSTGVAARACGLVGLEPTRIAENLKDKPSWLRDCRVEEVLNVMPTTNGGTIELLYMQLYALTTLAPGRDFWLLRYTSVMEDGGLVPTTVPFNPEERESEVRDPPESEVRGERSPETEGARSPTPSPAATVPRRRRFRRREREALLRSGQIGGRSHVGETPEDQTKATTPRPRHQAGC